MKRKNDYLAPKHSTVVYSAFLFKAVVLTVLLVSCAKCLCAQIDPHIPRPEFPKSPQDAFGIRQPIPPPVVQPTPPAYRPQGGYDPFNPRAQQPPALQPPNASQIPNLIYPDLPNTKPPTQAQIQQEFIALARPKSEAYNNRANKYLQEMYADFRETALAGYPIKPLAEHRNAYLKARKELTDMLDGKIPLSLKRAVFIVENTFDARLTWAEYNAQIAQAVRTIKPFIPDSTRPKLIYSALMKYWTDTTKDPLTQKIHLPIRYDFIDYLAEKDFKKYLVSKLLRTQTGQCHSMPLLYKILSDELGGKSFIAFAPMHSYIQHQDEKGNWLHLELTNMRYVNGATYAQTGYVKAENIKKGMYLTPLNDYETIVYCLTDLLFQYAKLYPTDPENFILESCHSALQYFPNFYVPKLLIANVHTNRFHWEVAKAGFPKMEVIAKNAYYQRYFNNMMRAYNEVDALGYEIIPLDVYDQWLHSLV